jgi:hypothetical protein
LLVDFRVYYLEELSQLVRIPRPNEGANPFAPESIGFALKHWMLGTITYGSFAMNRQRIWQSMGLQHSN